MPDTPSRPVVRPATLVARLWAEGQRPDLHAVLSGCGPCPPSETAAAVAVDLRERWRHGERVPVERYIGKLPGLADDPKAALAAVLAEVAARCDTSDLPRLAEYQRRFPDLAAALAEHFPQARTLDASLASTLNNHPRLPTPAEPLPAPDAETGVAFGPYRKLAPIPGATASYTARDAAGRSVVLKLPELPDDLRDHFRREARAARSFESPGLAAVLDGGEYDGRPYFATARVDGRTLADFFGGRPVVPRTAASLCRSVARALAEAHECGVVHRRLSVHHVLVDRRGLPVVVGFGLGAAGGPAGRVPPEAADGDPRRLGPAGDVWLVGALLYELLTGSPPGPTPSRPSALCPAVDDALDCICLKALATDPARRHSRMADLAAVLDRWCQGGLTRFNAAAPVRRFRPALVAVLAASLVGAGWLAVYPPLPPPPQPPPADAADVRKIEAAGLTARGWVLVEEERAYDRAITHFDRAIELDPRSGRAHLGRGCARVFKGRPDLGLADFERACELEPDNPRYHNARGWAHNERGHHEEAVAAATRALAESPAFAEAYVTRATAHLHAGRPVPALRDADRAVELAPGLAWAWQNRGLARAALGQADAAARDFAEARRLDPTLGP